MLLVRTTKHPAYPIRKLVCSQQTVGLDDLALGVHPLRLDGIEPRALLGQKAAHDPHPVPALLDFSVVSLARSCIDRPPSGQRMPSEAIPAAWGALHVVVVNKDPRS
jgi:hypothetical protein